MPLLPRLASLWRTLFRSAHLDRDLDEELRAFVDARTEQHVARGLSPGEARRAAILELGGVEAVKERTRQRRVGHGVETFLRDFRYGCRMMARSPGFAAVVVLTLALVIGANAAVFSVVHAVLWRELPYPDADRLVIVDADARGVIGAGLSDGERVDLLAEAALFDRLAKISAVDAHVTIDDEMEQVSAASATEDALTAFGAWPLLHGRLFDTSRSFGSDGFVRTVVVSHRLWQRRLGADPGAIGRRIEINNLEVEVIGVLRPDFRVLLPANTAMPEVADVWFPNGFGDDRRHRWPGTIARLAPGVSIDEAQARLDTIARRFANDHPGDYVDSQFRLRVTPLREAIAADAMSPLRALAAAVVFVLLVGCVNVGNLMLARARTRAPEMAVRRTLGAGRLRLVRQLATETAVLGVIGGAAGLLLAHTGIALIEWLRPVHLPRQSEIAVNGTVVLVTAGVSIGLSLLFGLLSALSDVVAPASRTLASGRTDVQRGGIRRLQRGLVVAEVALCIVPLVAGGLMLRTFVNLLHAPIGFNPEGVLTAKVPFSFRQYSERRAQRELMAAAVEQVRRLPGVRAVSAGGPLPFDMQFPRAYGPAGADAPPTGRATVQDILPGYLAITGVVLEAGRDFTADDLLADRSLAIVDERIAQQLWPAGAIGQQLALGHTDRSRPPRVFEVIGVVRPVRTVRVRESTLPHVFVPQAQFGFQMALVVDTDVPVSVVGPAIKRAVEALGTRRPVYAIQPMRAYLDQSMGDTRFTMLVIVAFSATALLLAGIGIYGTLAYLTGQRRQEFGVRMALGASVRRVLLGVIGEGLALTGIGVVLGLVGAVAVSELLRDLLYDVSPFDISTLVAVAGLIAIVALVATVQPAVRAARTDPATALRSE